MIKIENLNVSVEEKEILKGINLEVKSGELHVIMGRNGTGKSTLANVLVGKDKYKVTNGTVNFNGENLLDMSPEDRACAGLFLSFQYPVAIPGVNNMYFLKAAVNAVRKSQGEEEIDAVDFLSMIREKLKIVALDESFIHRPVNDGFSGGEPTGLVWFAHWVPPPVTPRRYATFFFAARLDDAAGPVTVDEGEITEHEWMRPDDALARRAAGEIELAPPTSLTLYRPDGFGDVSTALTVLTAAEPAFYGTHMARTDEGPVAMWEGDAGDEGIDPSQPGPRHRLTMAEDRYSFQDDRT